MNRNETIDIAQCGLIAGVVVVAGLVALALLCWHAGRAGCRRLRSGGTRAVAWLSGQWDRLEAAGCFEVFGRGGLPRARVAA